MPRGVRWGLSDLFWVTARAQSTHGAPGGWKQRKPAWGFAMCLIPSLGSPTPSWLQPRLMLTTPS